MLGDAIRDPGNYIETVNPFGLAKPPVSFLVDLCAYDDQLRLFASNAEPVYRVCRRARGVTAWQKLPPKHPDNPVLVKHKLTPLKAIQGFRPAWGQAIIQYFAERDIQRVGGGVAAEELLQQQEELEMRRQRVVQDDECDARSGEAYRGLKAQLGERVCLGKTPQGAGGTKQPFQQHTERPCARRPVYRPRDAGDHAIFVGR